MHKAVRTRDTFSSVMLEGKFGKKLCLLLKFYPYTCLESLLCVCSDFLSGKSLKLKNRWASDVSLKSHGLEYWECLSLRQKTVFNLTLNLKLHFSTSLQADPLYSSFSWFNSSLLRKKRLSLPKKAILSHSFRIMDLSKEHTSGGEKKKKNFKSPSYFSPIETCLFENWSLFLLEVFLNNFTCKCFWVDKR